jgi:hypothetical protein
VQDSSRPTAIRPGAALSTAAIEPIVSASAAFAPPCSRPSGCRLPSTGIVATIRSVLTSRTSMPSFSLNSPRIALAASTVKPARGSSVAVTGTSISRWWPSSDRVGPMALNSPVGVSP